MCVRMCPLSFEEAQDALEAREQTGGARVKRAETVLSEKTGKPVRRQYRFRLQHAGAFLLAGVQQEGRLSIVTTRPNAAVSSVHDRMPLVLGAGESSIWLGADFATLADRSAIQLMASPER